MKALIIEDEELAARRLGRMLKTIDPSNEILDYLDSINSVLDWFATEPSPDLVFLDIHLADGSAFEIFNRISIPQPIIFTTAYDQYAIQAFKVNAIDYLLKPVKRENLEAALQKYKTTQSNNGVDYIKLASYIENNQSKKIRRFLIRIGQNLKTVEIDDVAYFYTENKITFLVNKEGKRNPIDFSLENLEENLDSNTFYRINRQFIIRVEAISKMLTVSKSRVKLYLDPGPLDVIVSTDRSGKFKKWLLGS